MGKFVSCLLALLGIFAFAGTASAATYTWSDLGDSTWGTATNWTPLGGPPNNLLTDTAVFGPQATITNQPNIGAGSFSVLGISMDNSGGASWNLGGSTGVLTIGANGLTLMGTGTSSSSTANIQIGATQSWAIASGIMFTQTGALSGSAALTLTGAGALTLDSPNTAPNTFIGGFFVTGTTTLQAGGANNSAFQALRSNSVDLASGATLLSGGLSTDFRVGSLSGNGSVTLPTNALISILALKDSAFSGTITTSGGLTLRGNNGTTQTFSGNATGLTGIIAINSGATLLLSGTGDSTSGVVGVTGINLRGGNFAMDNTGGNSLAANGRLSDGTTLTALGGNFVLIGNSAGSSETVGAYTMNNSQNSIIVNNGGGTGASLTFSSFARTSGTAGAVNFIGAGTGTLGSAGNNSRIMFTAAVGLTNSVIASSSGSGILGFATVNGTDFASYGANGVVAVTATPVSGVLTTVSTQNSVLTTNGATIGSSVSYNTLKIAPTSNGFTLDLTGSGNLNTAGLLLAGSNDFTIRNTGTGTGGIIAGNQRFINVANAGTTLNVSVSLITSNNALTKAGDGILSLTSTTAAQIGGTAATKFGIADGVLRGTLTSLGGGAATGGAFTTIQLRGGVLEINGGGTLFRAIDLNGATGGGSITFDEGATERGDGGFSAINGPAVVTLVTTIGGSTPATLVWGNGAFLFDGFAFLLGSSKSDSRIEISNSIGLDSGLATNGYFAREIRVADNTSSSTDVARLSGVITGSAFADLLKTGAGVLELTNANTYAGNTLVSQGTLLVSNTSGSGTGTGIVVVSASGTVMGAGTIGGTTVVNGGKIQGGTGGSVTATNTLTTSTITLNSGATFRTIVGDSIPANAAANPQASLVSLGSSSLTKGTSASPYTISVFNDGSLEPGLSYTVTIATYGSTAGGLSASDFAVVAENFSFNGTPSVGLSGSALTVSFATTAVPEPGTILCFSAASLGLASWIRRRRNAKACDRAQADG